VFALPGILTYTFYHLDPWKSYERKVSSRVERMLKDVNQISLKNLTST
jgi:hypothetical protein